MADEPEEVAAEPEAEAEPEEGPGGASPCLQDNGSRGSGGGFGRRADGGAVCVARAELRQYLDEGGVLDAWSKCLTALYQEREKPENPIE